MQPMAQPHHRYIDLSDLNARYDQMAIQGLGGGSLGLGSSLGTASGFAGYRWNRYSAETAGLQTRANIALAASGYAVITVDGILGPMTCGAVKAVLPSELPSSCAGQASTAPTPLSPTTTSSSPFHPWNQFSDDTRALQIQTNAALAPQGYELIATDGILGAKTCGAVQAVAPGQLPSTCAGQPSTAPSRTAASMASAAAAAVAAAAAAAAAAQPTVIPSSTAPTVVIPSTPTTIPSGITTPVNLPPVVVVAPTAPLPPPAPAQASVSNGGLPWGIIAGGVAVVGLGAFLVTRKS